MAHEHSLDGPHAGTRDVAGDTVGGLSARLLAANEADRDRILLDLVRTEVVAATGGPGPVAADVAFRQLGVYRSIGTRLRAGLAAATGVRIPATLLFDYPTCAAVAGFLRCELLGE